ncbi:hypothetical protein BC830DRAFT_770290 [Chytriomyces sp. MP71]|nr:hypothetical protein BC830DRAFT_770290 [Chytriomyces sp. MP71]
MKQISPKNTAMSHSTDHQTFTDTDDALHHDADGTSTQATGGFFRREYEAVAVEAEPSGSSSSSSSNSVPPPVGSSSQGPLPSKGSKVVGAGADGVFGHLGVVSAAFDDTEASSKSSAEPPGYRDVFLDQVTIEENVDPGALPHYLDAGVTVGGVVCEDGDVLVDGMPVGDFFSFFANLFISMSFDFIGFLMTSMLATSHAAKCGAKSGLGITFMRYGMLVLEKDAEVEDATARYNPQDYDRVERIAKHNDMIAYIMILFGAFIMMRANADYVKAQRVRNVMLAATVSNA